MRPKNRVFVGRAALLALVLISLAVEVSAKKFFPAQDNAVPDYYLVLLEPPVSDPEAAAELLAAQFGAQVSFVYRELYPAFEAAMDEQTAMAMAAHPSVKRIHQDTWFYLEDVLSTPVEHCYEGPNSTNQRPLPPPCGTSMSCVQTLDCPLPGGDPGDDCIDNWGLDRIDQVSWPFAVDEEFHYSGAGTGVTVYTIDVGIQGTNREFLRGPLTSRVEEGVDAARECKGGLTCPPATQNCCDDLTEDCCPKTGDTDCSFGHGSHVAGIIGGRTFGLAKDVAFFPLRFAASTQTSPCTWSLMPFGQRSAVIRSLEFIAQVHDSSLPTAVVNMSLNDATGTWADVTNMNTLGARDAIIALASRDNILIVQSAGNQGRSGTAGGPHPPGSFPGDACVFTFGDESAYAGSDAEAIARIVIVAGFDPDLDQFDESMQNASNWGPCVDIWAPAADIVSSGGWVLDPVDNRVCRLTGTSMAAPHVSGVAALLLEEAPNTTPDQLKATLVEWATWNTLDAIGLGSPNNRARRAEDVVFEDGFSFDLSRWNDRVETNQGTLSICAEATMPLLPYQPTGEPNGLCVNLTGNDGETAHVVDERPALETSYYASFFADYGELEMGPSDDHVIFNAADAAGFVFSVRQRGDGFVKLEAYDSVVGIRSTPWIDHGSYAGTTPIVVSWLAGSPGVATISANGGFTGESLSLQNGARGIDQVELGAVSEVDGGTNGTLRIDTFGSWTVTSRGAGGICHPALETTCDACCNPW